MAEPRDPLDDYDAKQGDPCKTPAMPNMTPDELYGESLNPVRDDKLPAAGLKNAGK